MSMPGDYPGNQSNVSYEALQELNQSLSASVENYQILLYGQKAYSGMTHTINERPAALSTCFS
jgi:hypothetical protein